jgi:hypothetical protein
LIVGYSLEQWRAIVEGYSEAFVFAAEIWVPGAWAIIGGVGLTLVALLLHLYLRGPFWIYRVLLAPAAGVFTGGYFQALKMHGQACGDISVVLCLISNSNIAMIILASMLCVVFVYLTLPGRKLPRRWRGHAGGNDGTALDDLFGD